MPTQYEHANESEDCPVCGVEFAHTHLDITKPKEFIHQGLEMKSVRKGQVSPDEKASVAMMQNQEWWWDKFNESGDAARMEEEGWHLDVEGINKLLSEHRKMVVREIREVIMRKPRYCECSGNLGGVDIEDLFHFFPELKEE